MLKSLRASLLVLSLCPLAGCGRGSTEKDVSSVHQLTRGLTPSELPGSTPRSSSEPLQERTLVSETLSVEDAVRLGLASNPTIRAELRRIGVVRGERLEASVLPNPTVEFELLPERDSEYELRLEYELTEAIFAGFAARAYEPSLEAERVLVASRALGLAAEIRVSYVRHQLAMARRQVAEEARDGYEAALGLSEELLRAGNTTELETSLERLAHEKSKVLVGQMKLEELQTKQELCRLLGVRSSVVHAIEPLEVVPLPKERKGADLVDVATEKNLELRALELRAEGLGRRLGLAEVRGWVPRVAADFHALHTRPEVSGTDDTFRFGGGVTVEVPLFNQNQGLRVVLDAELGASLEEYQAMRLRIAALAETVMARTEATHERVRLFETEILPAQQSVVEQMRLQYNAMQVSLFNLLRTRQEQLDLKLAYYDARSEYLIAELERAALVAGATVDLGRSSFARVPSMGEAQKGGH
jgi:outer membrane protein, heavy metal efflux system